MNWQEHFQGVLSPEALWELALAAGTKALAVVLILALAKLVLHIGYLLTDRLLLPRRENGLIEERKAQTLQGLVKSILRYTIYFMAAITLLDTLGIGVTSVLAGAGIVGLAVGFGAQNLVRDIITGFFILLEDQYAIGEYVAISDISGIVEEIGLRVTKVRAFAGDLYIIPNGNITQVTNYSRGAMRALVDITVAYEEDIKEALAVLEKVSRQVAEELPEIVEGPTVLGVVALDELGAVLRVVAQTEPMYQWGAERLLRLRLKEALDERGIVLSSSRRVVIGQGDRRQQ